MDDDQFDTNEREYDWFTIKPWQSYLSLTTDHNLNYQTNLPFQTIMESEPSICDINDEKGDFSIVKYNTIVCIVTLHKV